MKMRFLIVAGAVAALAAPAGASATAPRHASQRAQIAHLSKLNRQLRTQLRNMTLVRDRTKAALATANRQIGSLQSQSRGRLRRAVRRWGSENAALQALLQQRTSERDAAQAQVTALDQQPFTD